MKAIMAENMPGYIGLNDTLPWNCPEDLQLFKKLTMGCTLLVGYNTSLTLPKLKGRNIIVDTREILSDDVLQTVDWCIGGKKTYDKYCHLFTEFHISLIMNDYTVGDVLAPECLNLNPKCNIIYHHFNSIK